MNVLISRFLWVTIIVLVVFYARYVVESANERTAIESMATLKESDEQDSTAEIRQRMAELDERIKREEMLKRKAEIANHASQKWSPTLYLWRILTAIYNGILDVQKWTQRLFSNVTDIVGKRILTF